MEVMSKLEGAYGLLVKSAHYAGELVACKRGSPLIMGIREPGVQRPRLAGMRLAYALVRMRLFCCQRLASMPRKGGMFTLVQVSILSSSILQQALLLPAVSSPRRSTARAGHPSPSESLECGSLEAFLASDASAFVEHTKRCDTLAACWLSGSADLAGKSLCSGYRHICACSMRVTAIRGTSAVRAHPASRGKQCAVCVACCSVVVLEDSDVVHLTRGGYAIYNAARENPAACVPRLLRTLDMEVSSIMKGGYDHYMQKEIHEQPESILQTMRGRVKFSRVVPKVCRRTPNQCAWKTGNPVSGPFAEACPWTRDVLLRSCHAR